MFHAVRVAGEIQSEGAHVAVRVVAELVDHVEHVLVVVGDIEAELEGVLALAPGEVVGDREALLVGVDARQIIRARRRTPGWPPSAKDSPRPAVCTPGSKSSAWRSVNQPKRTSLTMLLVGMPVQLSRPLRTRTESSPLEVMPAPVLSAMADWIPFGRDEVQKVEAGADRVAVAWGASRACRMPVPGRCGGGWRRRSAAECVSIALHWAAVGVSVPTGAPQPMKWPVLSITAGRLMLDTIGKLRRWISVFRK